MLSEATRSTYSESDPQSDGSFIDDHTSNNADIKPDSLNASVDGNQVVCRFNDFRIKVRPNNLSSIYLSGILEEMNAFVGENDLLKRSIVLIKCWCLCESRRFLWKCECFIAFG